MSDVITATVLRHDECGHPHEVRCPVCGAQHTIRFSDRHGYRGRGYWHCPVHPANVVRVRLPVARAFVQPKLGLKRLIAETAEGKTLDWQADAYGDFGVVTR